MLLIVNLTDKKTKKNPKAVPCQRAKNLFDVGLKKASIFIKRKIWRNFLLDLEQKYFDLGYFEKYLHTTPCELLNFKKKFALVDISGEIYDVKDTF